ncbi:hypothetical protein [Microcoleus sp. Pol12B4]|uniref:hypothetical protein n=1 Tax=Microcoleus sp. Pol12B4 TaxID=3055395 RepID=UPI002FD118D0
MSGRRKREQGSSATDSVPNVTDVRKKKKGRGKREEGSSATDSITDVTDVTHRLHHSQLAFYEQAFRPVPQENLYFVEQAEKPVADNGARYQM